MTGTTVPPLPERMAWIAREGVRGPISRDKVIRVTRRVMLMAHHLGLTTHDILPLVMDQATYRLARQIAHDCTPRQVSAFLTLHWDATQEIFDRGTFLSIAECFDLAETYYDARSHALAPRVRRVIRIDLDIAHEVGVIGKTALPLRLVSDRSALTGDRIPFAAVQRIHNDLAKEGEWLRLVESGRAGATLGKANLYQLIPASRRSKI